MFAVYVFINRYKPFFNYGFIPPNNSYKIIALTLAIGIMLALKYIIKCTD